MKKILLILVFCLTSVIFGQVSIVSKTTTDESCYGAKDGKAKIKISFPANQYDRIIYNRVDGTTIPPTTYNIDHKNIPTTATTDSVELIDLPGQKNGFTIFFYKNNVNKALIQDTVVIAPGLLVDTAQIGVGALNQNIAVCKGNPIKLFASSGNGTSYHWFNAKNNITSPNTQNPTIANADLTDQIPQFVYVTAIGNQGATCTSDTVSITPIVTDAIIPSFTIPVGICNNSDLTLQIDASASGADSYNWTMQNGTPSTQTGAGPFTVNYATTPGNYNITLTAITGTCTNTITKQIAIRNSPTGKMTVSSNKVCNGANATLSFTFTGTGPFTYIYSDGTSNFTKVSSASTASQVVTVSSKTTYTLVSVEDQGCFGTIISPDSAVIDVNPLPTASLNALPAEVCENSSSITLSGTHSGSGGTEVFSGTGVVGKVFSPLGLAGTTVTITYTYTDANGCIATDSKSIKVVAKPTVKLNPVANLCSNSSTITLSGSPSGGVFSGNGVSGNVFDPNGLGGTSQKVLYTYTDATTGCFNKDSIVIKISNAPSASVLSNDTTVCSGSPITIKVALTGQKPWVLVYNDGTTNTTVSSITASPASITLTPTSTGTFTLVSVADSNCTTGTLVDKTLNVTVKNLPVVTFQPLGGPYCISASPITMVASPTNAGSKFTTTPQSAISGNVFTPANAGGVGTKVITYTYTDAVSGCTNTATQSVELKPRPTSTFTATPTTACMNGNVLFAYTGNSTSSAVYTWDFDSPTSQSSSGQGPITVTWATGGVKNITLSVTEYSCTSTLSSRNVTVNSLPTAIVNKSQGVCQGNKVNLVFKFTGKSPWTYVYSDGTSNFTKVFSSTTVDSTTVQVSPASTTTYTLVSVKDGNGCTNTNLNSNAVISVVPKPSSNFTISSSVCKSANATINYAGTPSSTANYIWNFGSGTVISGSGSGAYQVSWPSEGTKTVKLIVNESNGCFSDTTTKTIKVDSLPTAAIFTDTSVCLGQNANVKVTFTGKAPFTATVTDQLGKTYNVSSTGYTAVVAVSQTVNSVYTIVSNSVSDSRCSGTESGSATVKVLPLPTAIISDDTEICEGTSSQFTINFNGVAPFTYSYTDGKTVFSGSTSSNPTKVTVTPDTNTTYTLVSVGDSACTGSGSGSALVKVIQYPVVDFSLPVAACMGEAVDIKFTGKAGLVPTFTWDFGSGVLNSDSASVKENVTWNTNGTETVKLTVSDRGCSAVSLSKNILIKDAPTGLIISPDDTICNGAGTNLELLFTGLAPFNYKYSDGTTTSAVITTSNLVEILPINPTTSRVYTLISLSDQACNATSLSGSMNVQVNPSPKANFTLSKTGVCENESVTVTYTGSDAGSAVYNWNNFNGATVNSGTGSGPYDISFISSATKNIKLVVTEGGCADSTTKSLIVTPKPTASIAGDTSLCLGNSTNLKLSFTGTTPLYYEISSLGKDTSITLLDTKTITPTSTDTYTLLSVVDFNGCIGTVSGSATVKVNENPVFTFTGPTEVCKNDSGIVHVNISKGISPYIIQLLNNTSSTTIGTKNTIHNIDSLSYVLSSNANLSVIVTDSNKCTTKSSNTLDVTLRDFPVLNYQFDSLVCINSTAKLLNKDSLKSGLTYTLIAANATINDKNKGNYDLVYNVSGIQYIDYKVTDGVCYSNSVIDSIQVLELPTATINVSQTTVCEADTVEVKLNFTGTKNYDFKLQIENIVYNDVLAYSQDTYTIKAPFDSTGLIKVLYLKDAFGCVNSAVDTFSITINPKPSIQLTGLSPVYCVDETLSTITANVPASFNFSSLPANSYKDQGAGVADLYPNIAGAGDFPFTVSYTNSFGCSDSKNEIFKVSLVSDAGFTLPLDNCNNIDTVKTIFKVNYGKYVISPVGLVYDTLNGNIFPSKSTPGKYVIDHILSQGGCPKGEFKDTIFIRTAPEKPILANLKDTIVCNQTSVSTVYTISNVKTGVNYSWSFLHNLGTFLNLDTEGTSTLATWSSDTTHIDTLNIVSTNAYCSSDTSYQVYNDIVSSKIKVISDSILDDTKVLIDFNATTYLPQKDSIFIANMCDSLPLWNVVGKTNLFTSTHYVHTPTPSTSAQAWSYKVGVKNACGVVVYSQPHTLVKIDGSANEPLGNITIDYNPYLGWTPTKYEVWRQIGTDTFKLYNTYDNLISDTSFTYLDIIQEGKNQCFRVIAINDTAKVGTLKSYSNIKCFNFKNPPKVFNVFTPNGDGKNEYLYVDNLKSYPSNNVTVVNRWGQIVFKQQNYNNDWDGDNLPAGTYFYILKVDDPEDHKTYEFTGSVLLVR
ncbi:MAG: gliding motility-associated C-terminal domain-containing protein [Cytophagales bacterium]